MKIACFFLTVGLLQLSAAGYGQNKRLTINANNQTVKEIIQIIEQKTDYTFAYNNDHVDLSQKVEGEFRDMRTTEILDKLFKPRNISYRVSGKQIILWQTVKTAPVLANRQNGIKIDGAVTDNNGEPLPGVTIAVRGSVVGTVSDANGEFTINVPSDTSVLVFSFVGYETQTQTVGKRRIIPVSMSEASMELGEVTVVAFGTQKKESVVASITTVKPEDLKIPSSNLTTALAGRMSGLVAYQRSGEPGRDDASFFIRGVTTFGYKKDPLILIDNNESTTKELSRLQPDDIESFSILKDATATALYGSRGANGVLLVATKSGKEGKMKLDIRLEEALSQPTQMVELADPITYMRLHNEAVRTRNPLGRTMYSPHKIDHTIAGDHPYVYPANDWMNMLFKKMTNNNRMNFNVSGGGKIVTYYVSGSLSNDNGVMKVDKRNSFNNNSQLNRYMLRSNINIQLTSTTEMIARMSGSFDDYNGPTIGGDDMFKRVMNSNPAMFPAYYEPDEANKHTRHILFGNHSMDVTNVAFINPYADMVMGYQQNSTSQLNVQFELKQKLDFLIPGLMLRGMFNTSRYAYDEIFRQYNPFYYQIASYDKMTDVYTLTPLNAQTGRENLDFLQGKKDINQSTYFESALTWSKLFAEKHDLSALVVYTLRSSKATPAENTTDVQLTLPHRNISFAGRFTYGFDSRYIVELNFGYNGSERFAKKERFGFFPSAGVAWIVSNERFWEGIKGTVNNLKLKATYGLSGNDAIGDDTDRFFYLSSVNLNDSRRINDMSFGTYGRSINYNGTGVSISRYANDLITWETSKKLNATIEAGFWNILDFTAEFYQEHRDNILMTRASIPTTMGMQAPVRANVGKAEAHGIDLSLNLHHNFNTEFWIQGMANFTFARSKYTVFEEPSYPDAPWKSHVGQSLNQQWGYIAERLFIDDEEVRNSPEQWGDDYMAGDIKYKDLNLDGKITELDAAPIGYPDSPEIVYGFGLSTGWKGLDFSFFFQGLAHESFWIGTSGKDNTMPFMAGGQTELLKAYANSYWSEDNRNEYAIMPRLSSYQIDNNVQQSNWWMRDGSFLRLKSVELGYTFPERITEKIKMTDLRIYLSGVNLLTFSKFKLWDPEMGGNGLGYPVQRVYNIGVQVSF